jgi:hypothetical protein
MNGKALRLNWFTRPPRVYVDAKILNMHDPTLKRETYVGYVLEGGSRSNVRREEAEETDDAEALAVVFAIEELKKSLGRFTVVCDHESVVSEANRDSVRNPSQPLAKLRKTLKENPAIKLEVLKANPAHGIVTEYVNRLRSSEAESRDGPFSAV